MLPFYHHNSVYLLCNLTDHFEIIYIHGIQSVDYEKAQLFCVTTSYDKANSPPLFAILCLLDRDRRVKFDTGIILLDPTYTCAA